MNSVEKGDQSEAYVTRIIKKMGYTHAIRSLGSLTPIDIIASNGSHIMAVQVKQRNYLSEDAGADLVEWATKFNATPYLAYKSHGRWVIAPYSTGKEIMPLLQ
ncbi:MAG: hypothetical protein JRN68_04420 [Nitrososphaerota archaeon]|nr:hypothetical protein [Ferrimicrobium acidiphilum]MDG6933921.1 hypothetical protein [Nitrososphaerota archaeon]